MPKDFTSALAPYPQPVRETALSLRALIREVMPEAEETCYGGAKVSTILYSIGGPNNVICGIGPAKDSCLLYLHRIQPQDSPTLKLAGKGKSCLHARFLSPPPDPAPVRALLQLALQRFLHP